MPGVPEDLDVFHLPHVHMKKLVEDIEKHLICANFGDSTSYHSLLDHLGTNFREFKSHEEIENQYIIMELLSRLPGNTKTTLENDLHSDNRLAELVTLVSDGLQLECSPELDRVQFGEKLKLAIGKFTVDFIPHMNEEEEVFLPLLVEHFTETELRELTQMVIELHHLQPNVQGMKKHLFQQQQQQQQQPSLPDLPPELLLKVFSYLSPLDLCNLSQLHSTLNTIAFDGSLWQHLHPVRWARHHVQFFSPLCLDKEELSRDLVVESDIAKELLCVEGRVNANLMGTRAADKEEERYMEKEAVVLRGIVEHLLPRVGGNVQTLDLAYGKAVSNEMVFRMLRQCPNLRYLDLSYTGVTDFAFKGLLGRHHNLWKLEYIDLTGCSLITDTTLQRVSQAMASHSQPQSCRCGPGGKVVRGEEGKDPLLTSLIMSGCRLITDVGLRSLAVGGGLPKLQYLDLSGLPNVTQRGLNDLVSACPLLKPELLFYCDNILDGPYATCANGCQNLGSPGLCCREIL